MLLTFEIGSSSELKQRYVRYQLIVLMLTSQIVLVTHGAFAHFLTEDWDVDDPMIGTAYKNGP